MLFFFSMDYCILVSEMIPQLMHYTWITNSISLTVSWHEVFLADSEVSPWDMYSPCINNVLRFNFFHCNLVTVSDFTLRKKLNSSLPKTFWGMLWHVEPFHCVFFILIILEFRSQHTGLKFNILKRNLLHYVRNNGFGNCDPATALQHLT